MPWVRLDEEFVRHPKVAAAGPLVIALQVAGLCYCNQNLTDGFVPRSVARTLLDFEVERQDGVRYEVTVTSGMVGYDLDCQWVIDLAIEVEMWEEVRGGYRIHDYLEYQPSKAQVLADREQKRAAGRKGGLASAKAKQASAQAPAQADAKQSAEALAQAKRQAESNPVPVVSQEQEPSIHPLARDPAREPQLTATNGRTDGELERITPETELARARGGDT